MKLIKCVTLFDGTEERGDCYVGFEGDEIKYVGKDKTPKLEGVTENNNEIIAEGMFHRRTQSHRISQVW